MAGKGLNGAALTMMAVGGVAVWSGINNVPLLDAFRSLARGQAPTPNRKPAFQDFEAAGASVNLNDFFNGTAGNGNAVVAEAEKWVGKSPYVYGGHHGCTPARPGDGVDCSSFVSWVMYACGLWKCKGAAMVAGSSMIAWGVKVPKEMRQPGDVVLWPGHHCGIIKDANTMINAACTLCGKVRYDNYSKRSGWIVLRAPGLAKASGTETGAANVGKTVTGMGK